MNTFEKIKEKADPFIKSYRDDLLIHDKRFIEGHPTTPFLHFTGEMGTYIAGMFASEDYPKKGERQPYLFGMAGRWEILEGTREIVPSMKTRYGRGDLCLYFDGRNVKEISHEKATELFEDYANRLTAKWRKEEK